FTLRDSIHSVSYPLDQTDYCFFFTHFTPLFPFFFFFFFNDTAPTEIYTLSLHDALPISHPHCAPFRLLLPACWKWKERRLQRLTDRKSTRLNSSHVSISYAVFCLKKKKKKHEVLHNETKLQQIHKNAPPHT